MASLPVNSLNYSPQPKQSDLLSACGLLDFMAGGERGAPVAEIIGYGGAAFGGKTYGAIGLANIAAHAWPGVQIGYFRRTYPELKDPDSAIPKTREMLRDLAKPTNDDKDWIFSNGSGLYFRHCQNEKDVYSYQSAAFDILIIDEATHFPWMMIDYLLTRNRVSTTAPDGFIPFAVLMSNPGNIGHSWYMQLFDVLKEHGEHMQVKQTVNPNGKTSLTYFIPAFIEDNQIGVRRDPGYEHRLMQRDPAVAKALRWGDWTVFAGQVFRLWNPDRHTIDPFEIPDNWPKWTATDWGDSAPFCTLWLTRDIDNDRIFVYREVYYRHMTDRQQARMIRDNTPASELIRIRYADPSMWSKKNKDDVVYSTADEYAKEGLILTKANNDRINGKRKISTLMANLPDGRPGIQIFITCSNLIRTLPALVADRRNPEDVDTDQEDHAYDALRYGLTSMAVEAGNNDRQKQHPMTRVKGL